jgi:signal transduction histidine kinase
MRRPPIGIRTFLLGTFLVLVVVPTLAGAAAWLIERDHQRADVQRRLGTAAAYLSSHRATIKDTSTLSGFASLIGRLDLLAQLVVVSSHPPGKDQIYLSPSFLPEQSKQGKLRKLGRIAPVPPAGATPGWAEDHQRLIAVGTGRSPATLIADLFHRPESRAASALAALITGVLVLVAGLAGAAWLAGRWMVAPLTGLSAQVDKVAGGDLEIEVPRSRIEEIANIAQAVSGMTAALGETAEKRAEADEARRFLVTSVAHDLRTPLFALRGHLQAIGSGLGDPAVHLERAEARADALERLIGNLFAFTRDDYGRPAVQLEALPVADIVEEVVAGLEPMARLRGNTFELDGDRLLAATVDRDRFRRALTNVLDNAIRYSPPHAPIRISWSLGDAWTVKIAVEDRGRGVDPGLLPHVFEPGVRGAPAATDDDGGAGLGLTISRRLLEHQHATLTLQNRPTSGAVVEITLPQATAPSLSPA